MGASSGRSVLQERVFAHFSALGWTLAEETTVGAPGVAFHPDLVLEKNGKRMAVRISDETLGTYQVGLFGAQCRRAKIKGLVVCESSPEVLEACENAKVDFLAAENIGEPIVVPVAKPRPLTPPPAVERPVEFEAVAPEHVGTPAWRWAIVAMIWAAALIALVYWLTLVF